MFGPVSVVVGAVHSGALLIVSAGLVHVQAGTALPAFREVVAFDIRVVELACISAVAEWEKSAFHSLLLRNSRRRLLTSVGRFGPGLFFEFGWPGGRVGLGR